MKMNFIEDLKASLSLTPEWRQRSFASKAYTAILVLFLVALLPMPYGFYFGMRGIVCVCLIPFFMERKKLSKVWLFALGALVILYNPIFPIELGSQIVWTVVNALSLYCLFHMKRAIEST